MSGDELDRTIEFLLRNAARSDARFDALRERNLQEHAEIQLQLRELGDHVTVMTETLTATLTAMNERDSRQDRRLAKLESHIERVDGQIDRVDSQIDRVDSQIERVDSHIERVDSQIKRVDSHIDRVDSRVERVDALIERIAKIVYSHVSDPHAHGPATG